MSKTTPTARERRGYAKQLRELEQRVSERITRLEAEALGGKQPTPRCPGDEPPAHEADPATRDSDDQVVLAILESEKQVLAETQAALSRLGNATFGKCERCGHAIGHARLEAMPYARHCIQCAGQSES